MKEPSNVAAVKDITNLKPGAASLVLDGKALYAGGMDVADKERLQIVVGIL